jgi:hypothetical protein
MAGWEQASRFAMGPSGYLLGLGVDMVLPVD